MEKISKNPGGKKILSRKINNLLIDYFKWIIVFLVLVTLASGTFWIILPKYRQVRKKIEAANESLKLEYLKLSAYLKNLNSLNDTYKSVSQGELGKIGILLPDRPDAEDLMAQIEALAKNNGLILTSLQVVPETRAAAADAADKTSENKQVKKIRITMNLSAIDYVALRNFLKVLESNLRLMDVKQLTFSPGGRSAALDILTYYLE